MMSSDNPGGDFEEEELNGRRQAKRFYTDLDGKFRETVRTNFAKLLPEVQVAALAQQRT
jgi:hypothetical protein